MPNHVTTTILTSPEVVLAITREHTAEEHAEHAAQQAKIAASYKARTGNDWPWPDEGLPERFVDFELIVPSPPNKETGGCNDTHEPGIVCWYQWNIEHWGTKWNGYSTDIKPQPGDLCRLTFDTAWSHPEPVIQALSAKFPDEAMTVEWADENLGYNVGSYIIKGGDHFAVNVPEDGSEEAHEMASRIKYGKTYAEVKAEWEEED